MSYFGLCARLNKEDIYLFVAPPDTTGATQLLDQINARLHAECRILKENLFTRFSTINREEFMEILGNMGTGQGKKNH